MNLSTSYLGFDLPNPFIAGAGPLSATPQHAKQVEDAGVAAIVLPSLFEEQLSTQTSPATSTEVVDRYLELLRKVKEVVDIPVFASINGHNAGAWLNVVKKLEQAGADALELNVYFVATYAGESASAIEQRKVEMVREIKKAIKVPLAVKLSPYYTSLGHFARNLEKAGADGMVLFNRSFEADIDITFLKVLSNRELSTSHELLLRLRWLSIVSGNLDSATLAVSGGVHTGEDAVKAIMCGASAVQLVSALLQNGIGHLTMIRDDLTQCMQRHHYQSLQTMRANVNLARIRSDYMRLLQSWERLYLGPE